MPSHAARFNETRTFVLVVVAALSIRILLLLFVPPLTDVYYYLGQGSLVFLKGADPYGHLYSGIPPQLATPGAERVYAYLPGVTFWLAPFAALGEVRLGLVVTDLLISWSLFSLRRKWSGVAAAVFLLAPWTPPFSTTDPNSTLVAMAFLGAFLVLESRGRRGLSSLSLGASVASSQFLWLIYPFAAVHLARVGRVRDAAMSALTAVVIALPLALLDVRTFIFDTLSFQFTRPVSPLVSGAGLGISVNPTLSGFSQALVGAPIPLWVRAVIMASVLGYLLYRTTDLASVMFNATVFLVAAIFILTGTVFWLYLELPFLTCLCYIVLRFEGNPDSANA